jgi:maleylacetate reductase
VIREFTYQALPMRVLFGPGTSAMAGAELDALGLRRGLVVCSPGHRALGEKVAAALGERSAGVLAEARMHVPAEVAAHASAQAARSGADSTVAVGGGSAIGLAKAIALDLGLPIVAIPTTYAGSEMTPVWGLTGNSEKRTGRDLRVLPRSVIYDPELTLAMPRELSVTSAVNAFAHAAEALYAPDLTPLIAIQAEEGARAIAAALPWIATPGADLAARSEAQYGAWLCGTCLGATTMSLHHKLCHVLGGLGLPHAPTHTVLLPYVLAFNAPSAPEAMAALGRALGGPADPAAELWRRTGGLGAPRSLAELGLDRAAIATAADLAVRSAYPNPRPVTREDAERLLTAAWSGADPTTCADAPPQGDVR